MDALVGDMDVSMTAAEPGPQFRTALDMPQLRPVAEKQLAKAQKIYETKIALLEKGRNVRSVMFTLPALSDWHESENIFFERIGSHIDAVQQSDVLTLKPGDIASQVFEQCLDSMQKKVDCSCMRAEVLAYIKYEAYRLLQRRLDRMLLQKEGERMLKVFMA